MDWTAFFGTLIQSEEPLVPFFAHDPLENAISAAVLVAESAVPGIIEAIQSAGKPAKSPAPPAATTVTATTSSSTVGPQIVAPPVSIVSTPGPQLVPSPAPGA